jgi:group I intron endonuclease
LKRHKYSYTGKSSLINKAILKYGWDNFEIFYFYVPECLLDFFETFLIESFQTLCPKGYNLESGGSRFKRHHENSKKKISIRMSKEKHPLWGTHRSEETKQKLSEQLRIYSDEERACRRKTLMSLRAKTEPIKEWRKHYINQLDQIVKRKERLQRRKNELRKV